MTQKSQVEPLAKTLIFGYTARMDQSITACAFVHKNGRLFIAKRADTKIFLPEKFELPGGHIEFGEDIMAGLKREFKEELGLEIRVGNPFYAFTYVSGDKHVIEVDYFAELADPNVDIKLNPEDHSEFRWVTEEEVDEVWDKNDDEYKAVKKGFTLLGKQ